MNGATVLRANVCRTGGVRVLLPERMRWVLRKLIGVRNFFGSVVEWAARDCRHGIRITRNEPTCLRSGFHGRVRHLRRKIICIEESSVAAGTAPSQQDLFGVTKPVFTLQIVNNALEVQMSIEPQAPGLGRGGGPRARVNVTSAIRHKNTMTVVEVWVDL